MTQEEAEHIAMSARLRFGVGDGFQPRRAEKRIIELVDSMRPVRDALPSAGSVRDTVAWVITLGEGAAEVEMAVEDATGEIVRYSRSRGAVASGGRIGDTDDFQ